MTHPLFDKHITLLRQAIAAAETRASWSPYPDAPASRGKQVVENGREAFESYRDASFYLDQPGLIDRVGSEQSPYGLPLNITYPRCAPDALIIAAQSAMTAWVEAGPDVRTGVCLEILDQLHDHGVEIAHAVMHTTGQPFALAYQYSLAGALDRGLEAVATSYREMKQGPGRTVWEKPQGKHQALKIERTYTVAPRGIALSICSPSEPTSLCWPGIFASLVTGNPVIVHAHSASVLPLAMTVAVARQVIKEAGFDPNLISLLVDETGISSANMVGLRAEIRIIDCCSDTTTAEWLGENAHQAAIFSLNPGANCVVIDSTGDYKAMLRNLTFSLCLNSGQLAVTPRMILVSREGVRTPDGVVSSEQFGRDLAAAIGKLAESAPRAVEILGAIQSPELLQMIEQTRDGAGSDDNESLLRDISRLQHPQWPLALVATPLLLKQELGDQFEFLTNVKGPIAFLAESATTTEALSMTERIMRDQGALNFSIYTNSGPLQQMAQGIASRVGVALNVNLTGNLLISQNEGFADFYASGENKSSTCSLIDVAFVARRFFVVQTRRQLD